MIVARLFTEELQDNEALVIKGVEQYNESEGYQNSFKWVGNYRDNPDIASKRTLVAIDAVDFLSLQNEPNKIHLYTEDIYREYAPVSNKESG
jgi:hypothetical protein